jgi:hypothetical protein
MDTKAAVIGQSSFDAIWWLCLLIVIALFIGVAYFLYWLGKLPGETAHSHGHPQASAITVCGWLGLLVPPLWPIALVWAYLIPAGRELKPPPDLAGIQAALESTKTRIAQIERQLGKAAS